MPNPPGLRPSIIVVISDATGSSAEQLAHAALEQFPGHHPPIQVWPHVRSADAIDAIFAGIAGADGLVLHTLVDAELVRHLRACAEQRAIACHDVMNPLLRKLAVFLGQPPSNQPGHNMALDEAYFRRIEAVEFTVNADDGRGLSRLRAADIVLVGVSRTSKTPVATYLAGQGYKVANVPLVRSLPVPPALSELERGRVFCLTIDAEKLSEIRSARMSQLGVPDGGDYADYERVVDEIRWARELARSRGWPIIDVTNQAIEETASQLLRQRTRLLGPT